MKLSLTRFAQLALTTSALVLALPMAQSEARPSHTLRHSAVTIALPLNGEVTDFSSRRRNRHVRHHTAASDGASSAAPSFRASHTRTPRVAAAVAVRLLRYDRQCRGGNAARRARSRNCAGADRGCRMRRCRSASAVPASLSEARRYLGTNPTGRGSLWCATFMNMVLERSGHRGTGSNLARSFASYGQRVSGPQVGAIAVMAAAAVMSASSRHRCARQPDHHFGQLSAPRCGSDLFARPHLRLRHADVTARSLNPRPVAPSP